MKKFIKSLAVVSIIVSFGTLTGSCKTTKKSAETKLDLSNAPDWVTGTPAAYPKAYYITALGNAPTDSASEDMAKSELLQIISLNMDSSTNYTVNATEKSDNQSFNATINSSSAIKNLTGIKIAKKYSANDGSIYSLAVLDRQETADYYASVLHANEKKIQENIDLAKKNIHFIESIGFIYDALELAQENEQNLFLINAMGAIKKPDVSLSYTSVESIRQLSLDLAGNVIVSINVKNDTNNHLSKAFQECFNSIGMKVSDSDADYVLQADAEYEEVETTDTKHVYVMFNLHSSLIEKSTKKEVLAYTTNGRAGHLSLKNATQRALSSMEKNISKEFKDVLKNKAYNR